MTTAFERERVRDLFARFVPENVVDEVLARADDDLRLGGVQRDGTVMFTDLRGFTSFAEALAAGPGDRGPQPLPERDERRDPRPRRHARRLHGRRDHGRLRRPDRAGRPRRPRARRRARDARASACRAFNEWIRSERARRGLPDGHRPEQRQRDVRATSAPSGGSSTRRSATPRTPPRGSRAMTKGTPHQLFVADSTRSRLARARRTDLVYVDEFEVRGRRGEDQALVAAGRRAPSGTRGRSRARSSA